MVLNLLLALHEIKGTIGRSCFLVRLRDEPALVFGVSDVTVVGRQGC